MLEDVQAVASEQVAAFPWVEAVVAFLVIGGIAWALVEAMKATGIASLKLKRRPRKDQSTTAILSKRWRWWPLFVLGTSMAIGAGIGLFWGSMSDLLWWRGLVGGALAGAINSLVAKVWRGLSDRASDVLLGPLKKWASKLGGGAS